MDKIPLAHDDISNERVQEFVQLLTTHQLRIRSFILSLLPNYNDAEDVMQETTSMMWSRFSEFEIGTDFLAWGRTIALYRVLDYRQNRKYKQRLKFNDELFRVMEREVKERREDRSEDYLCYLRNCLNKLAEKDQLLIRMRYQDNMKISHVARRVGVTVQSVYRNLSRVQDLLHRCVLRCASQEGLR